MTTRSAPTDFDADRRPNWPWIIFCIAGTFLATMVVIVAVAVIAAILAG
jgi:hypothetical protein